VEPTVHANNRMLAVIFFILLMDIMGLTILFPVAPYIVQRYSSDALSVSMITVIYAAAQFFAAPLMGKLGDRYGRRPVLLVSIAGSIIGYLIFGFGGALWVLFLSRLIDGFTGGNQSTAAAYIADVSAPKDLAKNFTLIGMAWGFGLILGPALGGAFGQINLIAPVFVAAGLSLIGLILVFFFLPESLPPERRITAPLRSRDFNPLISIGEMIVKPGLGLVLLVLCLFNLAFNGINATQTLFVIQKFSAQPWQVGLLLVMVGIAVAVVQGLLVRRLVPRYGEKVVGIASLLIHAVGALAAFFVPFFWLFFVVIVVNNGIAGFSFPTLTTLSVNRVSRQDQGLLMGVSTSLVSLTNIFGPLGQVQPTTTSCQERRS
jgi:MFS transporter, DHA1 family, tetracycline resistance protein